jgi:hypothetical protein
VLSETASAFTIAFLAMSCVSFAWQTRALRQLTSPETGGHQIRVRGLLRTSVCRVTVAALYVGVGVNELFVHFAEVSVTFCVFCIAQFVWQFNASADVRLRRSLARESSIEDGTTQSDPPF